jgi:hypothetical protein
MSVNQSTKANREPGGLQQIWNSMTASVTGKRDYAALAYRRNPDSLHDEALIIGWVVLSACIVGTGAYGIYYHYQIFSHAFSTWAIVSGVISCAIFVLGEVMKVGATLLLLRMLFTGGANKSPQTIFLSIGLLLLSVGTFWWSYDISTHSTSAINEAVKTADLRAGIIYDPATYTAPIDSQLASVNADIKRLSNMKVESGEISWPAQRAIAKAQETKDKLVAQRQSAELRYQSQQDSTSSTALSIIQQASARLADYGKWFEIVAAICLVIIIAPCESIGYRKAKQLLNAESATPVDAVATTPTTAPQDLTTTIKEAIRDVLAAKSPVVVNGFQQQPAGSPPTPPPPVGENRGSTVATTSTASPQPAQPTISHNSHKVVTEVVEDLEGVVMELCNKFKKEWPTRWRERVGNGGNLSTMQTNFKNWHDLLNTYLDGEHKPLSQKAQGRVEEFRQAYRDEILPTITTPQKNQQL